MTPTYGKADLIAVEYENDSAAESFESQFYSNGMSKTGKRWKVFKMGSGKAKSPSFSGQRKRLSVF